MAESTPLDAVSQDIEQKFQEAILYFKNVGKGESIKDVTSEPSELYALRRQGEGDVIEGQNQDVFQHNKDNYGAWSGVKELSREAAMQRYIEKREQHEQTSLVSRPLISAQEDDVEIEKRRVPLSDVSSPLYPD